MRGTRSINAIAVPIVLNSRKDTKPLVFSIGDETKRGLKRSAWVLMD